MTDFKVAIERIDADRALPLWQQAEHTTVFTHPEVLAALAHDVHWWLATTAGEPACVWPVCVNAAGEVTPPEFAYYLGPFEPGPIDPSPRRRLMRSAAVHHHLLTTLSKTYDSVAWSTVPGRHELRPWLWFEARGRRPVASPRFTAVIDGLTSSSDEDIIRRFSSERRNQVRRAERSGVVELPEVPLERVRSLYCETMGRSGAEDFARRRLGEVESLFGLVARGHGFLVACGLEDDDTIHAVWLVLVAKGRACSVLGISESAWRNDCFNAYGRFRALIGARERGARCYDFNGANSFARGCDKHSYGAEAELYFDVSLGPR
jgi:hypothetical protein